jgi:flagellar hook-associated protein 1 FlgK
VETQRAERMTEGENVLLNQLTNQRASLSGVSLAEEMTNLIKFQKSYSAAARIVTMLDDMLDKIVNGMGITR